MDVDKTMELLEEVTSLGPGMEHYTILGCARETVDERLRILGDRLGTRAIVYPEGRHVAVRVILEKLLEETDGPAYQNLSYRAGGSTGTRYVNPFAYDAGVIPFIGRREELCELRRFCNDLDPVRWWAVTGPGGTGKSRLVYEFSQEMKKEGWTVRYLKSADYADLKEYDSPINKTIVVADYVQAYVTEIGQWLEHLNRTSRVAPIRVLLIERDGRSCRESSWGETFLGSMRRESVAQEICWKETYLELKPMEETELREIMSDYAQISRKPLSGDQGENLMKILRKVDEKLCRPLYALFITDAWIHGRDPTHWDRERILKYIVQRETDYYHEKVKQLAQKWSKRLEQALDRTRVVATIYGDITLSDMKRLYPDVWSVLEEQSRGIDTVESGEDLLKQAGLLQPEDEETIMALRPDLAGEYFVLQQAVEGGQSALLFPKNWGEDPEILVLLFRLILDYRDELQDKQVFWENFFQFTSREKVNNLFYGAILVNTTYFYKSYGQKAVRLLGDIHDKYPSDEEIVAFYAKGLVNLSMAQKGGQAVETVRHLEKLAEDFPKNKEVAAAYAKGLAGLSISKDKEMAAVMIDRLEEVAAHFPDNEEMGLSYAVGLTSLAGKQEGKEISATIEKLESIALRFSNSKEIAAAYAKGLVILLVQQEEREAAATVDKLKALVNGFPDKPMKEKSKGTHNKILVDFLKKHEKKELMVTVDGMKAAMANNLPNRETILVEYAKGLVGLSMKQGKKSAAVTIDRLKHLSCDFPDSEAIQVAYAFGLLVLILDQEKEEAMATAGQLEDLAEKFPANESMTVAYAQGLSALLMMQEEDEESTLQKLDGLVHRFPGNKKIKTYYDMARRNLSMKRKIIEKRYDRYHKATSDLQKNILSSREESGT